MNHSYKIMKIRDTKRGHLGIKQPDEDVDVTGTVVMMRQNQNDADESLLKKSEHGLILFPQPHDDPNDPLNWPIWKRDMLAHYWMSNISWWRSNTYFSRRLFQA